MAWALSRRVDQCILHSLSKCKIHEESLWATYVSVLDEIEEPAVGALCLKRHVAAGRYASMGAVDLSYCGDEGNVNGMSMGMAAFALPSNVAWVAMPQISTFLNYCIPFGAGLATTSSYDAGPRQA